MLTCSTRLVASLARGRTLGGLPAAVAPACSVSASGARRGIYGDDMHFNYLHEPKVVQTNAVDSILRTKIDQYDWLQTQQWEGYSDTYLKRHMRYGPHSDTPNGELKFHHPIEDKVLTICYENYGRGADLLESVEADVLQPSFHYKVGRAKEFKQSLEMEIDALYPTVHPTFKLLIDAMLVRRFYQMEDWITLVERKRRQTLERLSPEFIKQQQAARGLGESYLRNLAKVEEIFATNPTHYIAEASGFSEEEMEFVQQRVMHMRKTRTFGRATTSNDVWAT